MIQLVGSVPEYMLNWKDIFEILLHLRRSILKIEKKSASTRAIEMSNSLLHLENKLIRLNISLPPMQPDFDEYWKSISNWLLEILENLEKGKFF